MKSLITKDFGITNAKNFEKMVSVPLANVYVCIGRSLAWANTSNTALFDDVEIATPYDTTEYKNELFRDGQLLKRITSNDIQPVIPRVDWSNNTVYVAYDQTANLFVKILDTKVAGGNVNVSLSLANTVNANVVNLASATPALTAGSIIKIGNETKEVVSVNAKGDFLRVNSVFTSAYTSANIFKVDISDTQYSNKFYVRNSKDQVFKCLFNNAGIVSNTEPQISLGGELPENPYVETADGYKWKYMYTIPTGLKNKFFTDKYMPVLRDIIVFDNAVDGRIDIIKIINGGSGYYAGSSVNNYPVVAVTGDGTLANVSVDVASGVIVDINILDGGNNYTTATITTNDPLQQTIGTAANLKAIISSQYGHGYDPQRELGGSDLMISVDFEGDVDGNLPVENDGTDLIRQISIIKDVKFANGLFATASAYPMYTQIITSNPPVDFGHNETVYVGSSFATATFSARVMHFDNDTNILYVNNIVGDVTGAENETIYQKDAPSVFAKVFNVIEPDINIFSGEILYIENRAKITRHENQTETTKLVVEF
jgi:hypothetical protein